MGNDGAVSTGVSPGEVVNQVIGHTITDARDKINSINNNGNVIIKNNTTNSNLIHHESSIEASVVGAAFQDDSNIKVVEAENREVISSTHSFIAGSISGIVSIIVGQPFDTVKVRLQIDSKYKNAMDCVKQTVSKEGYRSLYRGMLPPIASAAVVNAVVFAAYNESMLRITDNFSRKSTYTDIFLAGSFAGLIQTSVLCPTEAIKCKLQSQTAVNKSEMKYKGVFDCFKKVFQESGFRGIYTGLGATIGREVPAFGVYFSSYEIVKDRLDKVGGVSAFQSSFIAGGFAGVSSWGIVYPVDVIKSNIQVTGTKDSSLTVGRKIFLNQGMKGLYRGFGPTILRAFPVNAVVFPTYELTLYILGANKNQT